MAKPYAAKNSGRRVDAYVYGSTTDPKPDWFDESQLAGINVKPGNVIVCDEGTGKLITVTSPSNFGMNNDPVEVPVPAPVPPVEVE